VTSIPAGVSTNQPCMTVRVAGSRFKCKAHAGEALALSCRSKCSNGLYIGTPLLDDGARDLQGSFLILSVGAHTHPPPPITTSTVGLLLTAADVREHHHVSLAAEEEDVRDKLADEYGRVAAAVPQTATFNEKYPKAVRNRRCWVCSQNPETGTCRLTPSSQCQIWS